jgi:predicted dehydrogenase
MTRLRVAVIGVGHLGQIHARLLSQVEAAELVGIVDPSEAARSRIAAELKVPAFADHQELLGRIDAAIVAAPSRLHHAVASDLLRHGVHVFVEKPLTLNIGDADELVAEAQSRQLVLQVGHVERFNPAFLAAAPHLTDPKYIDANRSSMFTCRSTDVGVVLDLMIHDIDLALALAGHGDEVVAVEALGAAVIGPNEDWAQARLTFAGGCVANLFASRVAWQPRRTLEVICPEATAAIDLGARQAKLMRVSESVLAGDLAADGLSPGVQSQLKERLFEDYLPLTDLPIGDANPLLNEQRDFLVAIRGGGAVQVTGEFGRRALDIAERILAEIAAHRWEGTSAGAVGPRFASREGMLRGPHWRSAVRRKAG